MKLGPLVKAATIGGAGFIAGSYLERKFNIQNMLAGQQQYYIVRDHNYSYCDETVTTG